jgi:hypothetical protein
MRTIVLAIYILTLANPSLLAQETHASMGTLTGHVICSDTKVGVSETVAQVSFCSNSAPDVGVRVSFSHFDVS